MAHTFFCEKCRKWFEIDERLIGRLARCKDCGHVFPIPCLEPAVSSQAREAHRPAAAAAPVPAHDPYPIQEVPVLPERMGKPVAASK
jgi:hypothetical protein